MVEEKQDNRRKNWFARHKLLTVAGIAATAVGAVVWCGDYVSLFGRWWDEREAIKNLKADWAIELDKNDLPKYYELGCADPYRATSFARLGINPEKLGVLVNDPDLIARAEKKLEVLVNDPDFDETIEKCTNKDGSYFKEFLADTVGYYLWEIGEKSFKDQNKWDYYSSIRSKGGGYKAMDAAQAYGLKLEHIVKVPHPKKEDFDLLKKHRIPVDYSVSRLQKGKSAEDIVESYSLEKTSVSSEVRENYWKRKGNVNLQEDQIKIFAANGFTPGYFGEIAKGGNGAVRKAVTLTQEGKLNGKIFNSWYPEASIGEMFFGIQNGYTSKDVTKAHGYGITLMDYDLERQLYLDFTRQSTQPMMNGAPK